MFFEFDRNKNTSANLKIPLKLLKDVVLIRANQSLLSQPQTKIPFVNISFNCFSNRALYDSYSFGIPTNVTWFNFLY